MDPALGLPTFIQASLVATLVTVFLIRRFWLRKRILRKRAMRQERTFLGQIRQTDVRLIDDQGFMKNCARWLLQISERMRNIREHSSRSNRSAASPQELSHLASIASSQGMHQDAAELLVQAKMHREAISLLEEHGLIHEAAEILLNLDRAHRAGAIYEKHGFYREACHCYLIDGMLFEAGRSLEQEAMLCGDNAQELLTEAANLYQKCNQRAHTLRVLEQAMLIEEFVKYAFREKSWSELAQFMSQEGHAKKVMQVLTPGMFRAFIRDLPNQESTAKRLALWAIELSSPLILEICLKRFRDDPIQLAHFWKGLGNQIPEDVMGETLQHLAEECKANQRFLLCNAKVLASLGQETEALRWRQATHACEETNTKRSA